MWICEPPSSTMRRASAAYSWGVYGIAGHWSRLAIAPLIEQLMTTGSSKRLISLRPNPRRVARFEPHRCKIRRSWGTRPGMPGALPSVPVVRGPPRSYRHHPVLPPGPLDALARRHSQAADDGGAGLARVDDVVDQVVVGGDVGVDHLPDLGEHRLPGRLGVV